MFTFSTISEREKKEKKNNLYADVVSFQLCDSNLGNKAFKKLVMKIGPDWTIWNYVLD